MTTYTLFNHGSHESGLSAVEAAKELLSHDGHEYDVRPDADNLGWFGLWISRFSRNSTCGGQPLVRAAPTGTSFVAASNAEDAFAQIAVAVVECGAWDSDQIYVLTDEQAAEMAADLDAEMAADLDTNEGGEEGDGN